MRQVLIRKLDDETLERLRLRAKNKGESLEQYLRAVLEREAGPSKAEVLAQLAEVRAMSPAIDIDVSDIVRQGRDERDAAIWESLGMGRT